MPGGRPPKPSVVKLLEGNPGKRRVDVVVCEAYGKPDIPAHLDEHAADAFQVILDAMPEQLYGRVDRFAIAAFATAWAWHVKATEELEREGPISISPKGHEGLSPWWKVLQAASAEMRQWGGKLGLDPLARQQLKPPGGTKNLNDKFGDLAGKAANARKG